MSTDVPNLAAAASVPEAAPIDSGDSTAESVESQALGGGETGDVVADLQEQAATGTPKQQAAAKKMLKKLSYKYNGEEFEEDLPFEIPDDEASMKFMRDKLQMNKLARTKASEYNVLEKEVKAFVEELRKNPRKALSNPDIGIDIKKLAKEVIEEEIENSQKTPEQIEIEKARAELKAMKEERDREKNEAKEREFEALQAKEYERLNSSLDKAFAGAKIPRSPYTQRKVAEYMMLGIQEGIDVQPEDIIPIVEAEMASDLKEMFAVMPDEVIESIVGKDVIGRIRKRSIGKAKATPPAPLKSSIKDVAGEGKAKDAPTKINMKDFFKNI